jgi:hypothetical protein
VLKKEGDAIVVEKIKIPELELQPGLTKWNKEFNDQTSLTSRIIPTILMEGFFIAKIKKIKSTIQP